MSPYQNNLNQLDPYKRYFYQSDIEEFSVFETELDDQLMAYELTFFNLTHERLLTRIEESKDLYKEVLKTPFDFTINEEFNTDYEQQNYVSSKKEMKERWRQQLKFSAIANYYDIINTQEAQADRLLKIESMSEEEKEKAVNNVLDNEFKVMNETEMEIDARDRISN